MNAFDRWHQQKDEVNFEVIIVDDGSSNKLSRIYPPLEQLLTRSRSSGNLMPGFRPRETGRPGFER